MEARRCEGYLVTFLTQSDMSRDVWRCHTRLDRRLHLMVDLHVCVSAHSVHTTSHLSRFSYFKREFEDEGLTGWQQTAAAGLTSGLISATATNPIWMIKTRMQIQKALKDESATAYKSFWDAVVRIPKEEGYRAYMKGIGPALMASYHGAIQFTVYEMITNWCSSDRDDKRVVCSSSQLYLTLDWRRIALCRCLFQSVCLVVHPTAGRFESPLAGTTKLW